MPDLNFLQTQWHPKNGDLKLSDLTTGSHKNVWWLCGECKTPGCTMVHEWQTRINSRLNSKTLCPFCESTPHYLCPCDSLAHKFPAISNQLYDKTLDPFTIKSGGSKKYTWICPKQPECNECATLHVWEACTHDMTRTDGKASHCPFCSGRAKRLCLCKSLQWKRPQVALMLHPTKNESLKASDLFNNSSFKYWWKCEKCPQCPRCATLHDWFDSPNSVSNCPFCSTNAGNGKYVCLCRSIAFIPDLLKEFDHQKNGDLRPENVSVQSDMKVWWKCARQPFCLECGTEHSWYSTVGSRTREKLCGCPFCSNKGTNETLCKCKTLGWLNHSIASQLKDKSLDPFKISAHSNVRYEWICHKRHTWKTAVGNRMYGYNCPDCITNKAEEWLAELLDQDSRVTSHQKKVVKCFDSVNNIHRNLTPDQQGELVSGQRFMIELDGTQHFQSVEWWGSQRTDFRDQVCRDIAKNKNAQKEGRSILRITYLEYNEVDHWVDRFFHNILASETSIYIGSNPQKYNNLKRDSEHLL